MDITCTVEKAVAVEEIRDICHAESPMTVQHDACENNYSMMR